METNKVAVIGFYIKPQGSIEKIKAYILSKANFDGRILFTFVEYLTKYTQKFDRARYRFVTETNGAFPNGTLKGIMGMVNRSEIDIGIQPVTMNEISTERVDFSYPNSLLSATFVTRKSEYKPQIFGIFQTFSVPLWITIISTLLAITLLYYVIFRRKYSLAKILLQAFAVLLRQSSILTLSSMIEKLLVFSWVVAAMFLCLAYDSVFLSFLSFPPITQIRDVQQLARAVKEGHYHCIASVQSSIFGMLLKTKDENLRIIGQDLKTNNLSNGNTFRDFFDDQNKQDLAFIVDTDVVDIVAVGKKFVSKDRFLEDMAAMPVRKDFCCKKLVEKFTHRLMASGLYNKYKNDKVFLNRMPRLLKYEEKDNSKRNLTLTDVAPAFILLIVGHIISFLVFMVEILSNCLKNVDHLKKKRNNKNENRIQKRFYVISIEN